MHLISDADIEKILGSKFVCFEEVKDKTTEEFFGGNQFSIDAFNKKYTAIKDETYVQALKRVCDFVASVEVTQELRNYWSRRWFNEIYNGWWHPAGSIMQGAGSGKNISLCNCTTTSLGLLDNKNSWDSLEGIIKNCAYTTAKIAAYRQGQGMDFSRLRPRDTKVYNSSQISTGSVHWMQFIDSLSYYVGQKGRIPALLFSLSCTHPDLEEFIKIKSDYGKIQNANISVQCTDAFYDAVLNNKDWELFFDIPEIKKGEKVYIDVHSIDMECLKDELGYYYIAKRDRPSEKFTKTVKARKILEMIAQQMCWNAEPGIQNIDIARKYSNSDYLYDPLDEYDTRIIGSNACSEQYLSRESLCVLSSLNVGRFSIEVKQFKCELSLVGESINRFLDNVNECELVYQTYATPHQKLAIQKLRRTGAGYANIVEWLFKQNKNYGETEGNDAIEEFTKWYNYYLYKSSIELGKEKGSFGAFKQEKFEQSPFIQRMMDMGLKFTHMRNVTCSSIAPTGTLFLMFPYLGMSYGIESAFGMYFWKRCRIAGKYEYYFCVPRIVRDTFAQAGYTIPVESDTIKDTWDGQKGSKIAKFIEEHKDKLSIKFKRATEINPLDKLDLMAKVMKWIDSSISVTYMLPENADWKDVYNFILEAHKRELKSIAAFPDKKMYGIVSDIAFKDLAIKLLNQGVFIHDQNFDDNELKQLNLARQNINVSNNAPKRLKALDCDLYYLSTDKENVVVAVGLQNGVPYEIFGGHVRANDKIIKDRPKHGQITKRGAGQYSLNAPDIEIENFSNHFNPIEQSLFRMISTIMRHGVPIQYIVDQLSKSSTHINSLDSLISRTLKKYIKDGQKVVGKECPQCKNTDLSYLEGCITCHKCNWSKCS